MATTAVKGYFEPRELRRIAETMSDVTQEHKARVECAISDSESRGEACRTMVDCIDERCDFLGVE